MSQQHKKNIGGRNKVMTEPQRYTIIPLQQANKTSVPLPRSDQIHSLRPVWLRELGVQSALLHHFLQDLLVDPTRTGQTGFRFRFVLERLVWVLLYPYLSAPGQSVFLVFLVEDRSFPDQFRESRFAVFSVTSLWKKKKKRTLRWL